MHLTATKTPSGGLKLAEVTPDDMQAFIEACLLRGYGEVQVIRDTDDDCRLLWVKNPRAYDIECGETISETIQECRKCGITWVN